MTDKTCTLPECDEPYRAQGLCNGHYMREYRKNDERPPWVPVRKGRAPATCTVPSCSTATVARGYCDTHYRRVMRYGSPDERRRPRREQNWRWRGGRREIGDGYIGVRLSDDHPLFHMMGASGYAAEHRVVMATALGRDLRPDETVHHINGDRGDNRLENLQLRFGNHGRGIQMVCRSCGSHDVVPEGLT